MLAEAKSCGTYARRRSEHTPCYKIVLEYLNTFIAEREAEGRPLPAYVVEEFDAYLKCGIPAYGFLRLECHDCQQERIVAFSCKKRGFCPSCCTKRMMEASTHLIDNVLPLVPYRQFVVSFPIPLRYWLHSNKKLYTKIHKLVITEIHRYYTNKATNVGIKDPTPGSISFTQRWGSALNLNPHIHCLCPDGVYTRVGDRPHFRNIDPITDEEVAFLIEKISKQVMRYLKRHDYLDQDGEVVQNPMADALFQEHDSLVQATACSISGKIAFGPNAGKYVTRIGSGFGYGDEIPFAKGKRCFTVNGFSLHANTSTRTHQRDRLENLIQYVARGPLANERLEILDKEKVKLKLKTPYSDGTTHLLFSFGEFLEKLTALVPPPKTHLVRWGGCFAPNSPYRKEITVRPEVRKGFQFREEGEKDSGIKNYSWSKMLARAFKIDVTTCDRCGGSLYAVCSVMERDSVRRYLKAIGVDDDPPARAPPKYVQESFHFDQSRLDQHEDPAIYIA